MSLANLEHQASNPAPVAPSGVPCVLPAGQCWPAGHGLAVAVVALGPHVKPAGHGAEQFALVSFV